MMQKKEYENLKQQLADANAKIKKYDEAVGKRIRELENDIAEFERQKDNLRKENELNVNYLAINARIKAIDIAYAKIEGLKEIFPDAAKKQDFDDPKDDGDIAAAEESEKEK